MSIIKKYIHVYTDRQSQDKKFQKISDVHHSFDLLTPFEEEQDTGSVLIQGNPEDVAFIFNKLFPDHSLIEGYPETVAYDL